MLKNILNLEGAQKLTKNEQKSIKAGYAKLDNNCNVNEIPCICDGEMMCVPGVAICKDVCPPIF